VGSTSDSSLVLFTLQNTSAADLVVVEGLENDMKKCEDVLAGHIVVK